MYVYNCMLIGKCFSKSISGPIYKYEVVSCQGVLTHRAKTNCAELASRSRRRARLICSCCSSSPSIQCQNNFADLYHLYLIVGANGSPGKQKNDMNPPVITSLAFPERCLLCAALDDAKTFTGEAHSHVLFSDLSFRILCFGSHRIFPIMRMDIV